MPRGQTPGRSPSPRAPGPLRHPGQRARAGRGGPDVAVPSPGVPALEDLESALLRHRFEDTFNPPALTNFLGAVQVDHDLFALRSVNFPRLVRATR